MDIKQLNEELEKVLKEDLNFKRYKNYSKNYSLDDIIKYSKTFKLISAKKKDIFNHLKYDLHITKLDNGHYCFWFADVYTNILEVESLNDIVKYCDEFHSWGFDKPKYEPELDETLFNQVCPAKKNKK